MSYLLGLRLGALAKRVADAVEQVTVELRRGFDEARKAAK